MEEQNDSQIDSQIDSQMNEVYNWNYQHHPHQSRSHHLKSFKHKPRHRLLTRPISLRADISGETIPESFGQFWRLDIMLVMSFYEVI